MAEVTRRAFLSTSVAGSLTALSGCCGFGLGARHNFTLNTPNTNILAYDKSIARTEQPRIRAIDAHAHFFNASDLQAGGYLAGPIANEFREWSRLIRILEPIVEIMAREFTPSAVDEWRYLNQLEAQLIGFNSKTRFEALDQKISEHKNEIAEELFKQLKDTQFGAEYNRLTQVPSLRSLNIPQFTEETIRNALSYPTASAITPNGDSLIKRTTDKHPDGLLAFVGNMMSYRLHNIRTYQRAFKEDSQSVEVVAACGALVDFDRWVGKCPKSPSSMYDQVMLCERLAIHTNGFLLPLVAYNPWTAIDDNGSYLALIDEAVIKHGFVGVKIYPPIGYYPTGNSIPGRYPPRSKAPDLKKLDTALFALYDKCLDLDIPVMAHGNHSMGAEPHHKPMGGPDRWKELLDTPKYRKLRVNIGHFGGNYQDGISGSWTDRFIDVMKTSPFLYGDIGYWDELAYGDRFDMENFKRLLGKPINDRETVVSRAMFGTDWFMLSQEQNWHRYADLLFQGLKSTNTNDELIRQFFIGSCMNMLGLNAGNGKRMLEYQTKLGFKPDWASMN